MQMIETLLIQYGFSRYVLKKNTAGLSHEESIIAPREGGNCVNWILGHIIASRNSLLEVLGEGQIWSEEISARYARGSSPIVGAAEAMPWSRLLTDFEISQDRLVSGFKRLDPQRLVDASQSGAADSEIKTLGDSLAIHSFHESYHLGQLGILRRVLGKTDGIT